MLEGGLYLAAPFASDDHARDATRQAAAAAAAGPLPWELYQEAAALLAECATQRVIWLKQAPFHAFLQRGKAGAACRVEGGLSVLEEGGLFGGAVVATKTKLPGAAGDVVAVAVSVVPAAADQADGLRMRILCPERTRAAMAALML